MNRQAECFPKPIKPGSYEDASGITQSRVYYEERFSPVVVVGIYMPFRQILQQKNKRPKEFLFQPFIF